jgi:hypothetical protein
MIALAAALIGASVGATLGWAAHGRMVYMTRRGDLQAAYERGLTRSPFIEGEERAMYGDSYPRP